MKKRVNIKKVNFIASSLVDFIFLLLCHGVLFINNIFLYFNYIKSIFYVTMILYDNNTRTLFNKTLLVFFSVSLEAFCVNKEAKEIRRKIVVEWERKCNYIDKRMSRASNWNWWK